WTTVWKRASHPAMTGWLVFVQCHYSMKTVDQVEALSSDLPEEVRLWLFPRKRRKRSGRKNAETRKIGKRVAHPAARLRDPAKNHRLLAVVFSTSSTPSPCPDDFPPSGPRLPPASFLPGSSASLLPCPEQSSGTGP